MRSAAAELDLVLVGGGHAHVSVLRRLAMARWPGVRVTLVSREVHTPYSGMLPGHVAGHYDFDDVHIDLGPLAAAGEVRLLHAEIRGVDTARRQLLFADRPALRYDLLSLNTGSTPDLAMVEGAVDRIIPVKPISAFLPRLERLLARVSARDEVLDVAVVGAGPGGVELTLALAVRLARDGLDHRVRLHLICAGDGPLSKLAAGVRQRFRDALARAGVTVHAFSRVVSVDAASVRTADGRTLPADEVLWVTHAGAPAWGPASGLALDDRGFICVGPTLQSRSHEDVFAVGDVAALTHAPRPKSGVFAVRAGPVLADNLEAWIRGRQLRRWQPQRRALYLISTGGRHAVVVHDHLPAWQGAWVWRWKDHIDRRFMTRFRELPAMANDVPASMVAAAHGGGALDTGMRCSGCGSKVGAATLGAALASARDGQALIDGDSFEAPGAGHLLFDDAAPLPLAGVTLLQTIDGFPLPLSDPWLGGRIAALHALGDVHAMGADAIGALALATVPFAAPALMAADLAQLMAGVRRELDADGCALVGGHSSEGSQLALGLAVTAQVASDLAPLQKGGGRAGDVLLLTKALGTGTILAGTADGRLPSRHRDAAVAHMLHSNRAAVSILRAHGARGCTDVTGFGLLGHALEMADASGAALTLRAGSAAALPGALDALALGIVSSLQRDNEAPLARMMLPSGAGSDPRVRLLCDPQTAGGLLAAVPESRALDCLRALQGAGFVAARQVGRLTDAEAASAGGTGRTGVVEVGDDGGSPTTSATTVDRALRN